MSFFDAYWTTVNAMPMKDGRPATRYEILRICLQVWKERGLNG